MPGRPNNGGGEGTTYVPSSQFEPARLRRFCSLNAILYLCSAAMVAFFRSLGAKLVDDGTMPVAAPLLAQEQLCAASLVVLAGLLLWARGAISLDPAARERMARMGRLARVLALVIAAICAAGVAVVLLLPITDAKLPTMSVTVLVIVSALYTYAGMAKLPR
ncbi:MAG: hypothetical protein ACRDRI_04320 [Pseudonocardiaceae bacterium]